MTIHTRFVIRIGDDEECILQDLNVELLEERIRRPGIGLDDVIHQLDAGAQSNILYFAIVVFAGPHAGVDHEMKLAGVELEECFSVSVSLIMVCDE